MPTDLDFGPRLTVESTADVVPNEIGGNSGFLRANSHGFGVGDRIGARPVDPFSLTYTLEIQMNVVEQIEGQIKNLNADDLRAFRGWFARFDAEVWDRQLEDDAENGKLMRLAERALLDDANGRSTEL